MCQRILRENGDSVEESVLQHAVDVSEGSGDEITVADDFLEANIDVIKSRKKLSLLQVIDIFYDKLVNDLIRFPHDERNEDREGNEDGTQKDHCSTR